MAETNPPLSCHQLRIQFATRTLLQSFSFHFDSGMIYGLLGANGSGKTSLLHRLCGLEAHYQGHIQLGDTDLAMLDSQQRAQAISLLTQHASLAFPVTVYETILAGRLPYLNGYSAASITDQQRVSQLLQQFQLTDLAQAPLQRLSGGELQRVLFAQLLCQDTPIQLFDEPLNHLDLHFQQLIKQALQQQKAQQKTMIISLHDVNTAYYLCDHILLLQPDGQIITGTPQQVINESNLYQTYQHNFIQTESPYGPFFIAKPYV